MRKKEYISIFYISKPFRLSHNPPLSLSLSLSVNGSGLEGKRSSESGSKPPVNQDAKPNRHWQPYRMSVCVFWNGRLPRQISICFLPPTHLLWQTTVWTGDPCVSIGLLSTADTVSLYHIMGIDNLHLYMGKRFRVQHWHTLQMLWFQPPRFTFTHGWEADESGWKWREKGRERDRER